MVCIAQATEITNPAQLSTKPVRRFDSAVRGRARHSPSSQELGPPTNPTRSRQVGSPFLIKGCATAATFQSTLELGRLLLLMHAVREDGAMSTGPFIDDPRDVLKRHVALAVESPLEEVRAIHIRTAEHYAEIAKDSSLPLNKKITN